MLELRIHGRGGQGVVTTAELLAAAAFREGRHAQAFPSFGSERTGAPVVAFCRIADRPIRTHEPIAHPEILIIQDPTLLHVTGVLGGIADDGLVLVNSSRDAGSLGLAARRVATVPAGELGRRHVGRPLPGAALLGALAALTGVVSVDAVAEALRERFSGALADGNVAAARDGYALARQEERAPC
jgi:pyruvate ferredoxin oxidoreductase gamma subunit